MTVIIDPAPSRSGRSLPWLAPAFGHAVPPTAQLLTEGGDERIALDPIWLVNKYGCEPHPDPAIAAFGSSTASTISERGFAAADRLRLRLLEAAREEPRSVTYARELRRLRGKLLDLAGLSDLPGMDVVFAPSGTDLHLLAAQLVANAGSPPPLAVMVEATETGSGVPAALAGRRFTACSALGNPAPKGTAIPGGRAVEVAAVPVRAADGSERPLAAIDAEVEALVAAAAVQGRRVLLVLVDVSKTGVIVPSPAVALALRRRFPDAVDVVVDACQFRLAPATLRAYLAEGFAVAVTGSKFLSGPAFSGALLVPGSVAERLGRLSLPPALRSVSARADWPSAWAATAGLRDVANYGLLLRWEAALAELAALRAVPEGEIRRIIAAFTRAARARLAAEPVFEPLPAPALDRSAISVSAASWDSLPTILPFLLRAADGTPLGRDATEQVYRLLAADAAETLGLSSGDPRRAVAARRCQVGQPVAVGVRGGVPVSALRLCLSARLIVEAAGDRGQGIAAVIERALAVLDKAALLVRTLHGPA